MRLQFSQDFPFAAAHSVVPYLAELGISHLYASPILAARAGSPHGYDVVDASRINPELGGETAFRHLVAALRAAGLGIIVDIVPNHMAAGHDNAWWNDVLQHGQRSAFAAYFDIDWDCGNPALRGKLLAPFLGQPYGACLAAGELRLEHTADGPVVRYFDSRYPIDPASWTPAMQRLDFDPARAEGRANLHRLLERQHYRLTWWGTAGDEINWRRFFDINGLVGVRVERPDVFAATHATLFRLYAEGLIDGVRVDHVDGLADPPGYCRCLRAHLDALRHRRPDNIPAGPAYIVVEKILGAGEALPTDWGVDGTSGYDFMDSVSAVQHDGTAAPALAAFWADISGRSAAFEAEETEARQEILSQHFAAQCDALAATLHAMARGQMATRDITLAAIRHALIGLIAQFRVYRGYAAGQPRAPADAAAFRRALAAAKANSPALRHTVLEQLDAWLGGAPVDPAMAALAALAGTRFQQLTAPVAAKAVEDTAFYRYGRLLSRNDVGFDAATLAIAPEQFHTACQARAATLPAAMLATATHDHKRGEDVRSRLAVLSECPAAWQAAVRRWREHNRAHRPAGAAVQLTDGDEAMLYQMIVGAWPTELAATDRPGCQRFAARLAVWLEKAVREAKLRTSWALPDLAYETAARGFLAALFQDAPFLAEAAGFAHRIGPAGAINGLAQLLLKLTAPGVPDFFQGTEFWDFSLVDPDNRQPVDFAARAASLRQASHILSLAPAWRDGRIKQALIARVLDIRRRAAPAFERGSYLPVSVDGPRAAHIVAFLRSGGDTHHLIVAPRLPWRLRAAGSDAITIPPWQWTGTWLRLPRTVPPTPWTDGLTATICQPEHGRLAIDTVLKAFPLAVLQTPA